MLEPLLLRLLKSHVSGTYILAEKSGHTLMWPLKRKHWVYDSPKWEPLRQRVFKRDGRKCKKCGSTEDLQIDHRLPLSKFPELAFCFDNLRPLCKKDNQKKGAKIQISPKVMYLLVYALIMKLLKRIVQLALIIFFGQLLWHDLAYHPFSTTLSYMILSDAQEIFYELLRYLGSLESPSQGQ